MTVPVHKLLRTLICLGCAALVGVTGYLYGALRQDSPALMLGRQTPGLDYFLCSKSFSEVENGRALFEALSNRWITELRQRRFAMGLLTWSSNTQDRSLAHQRRLAAAINDLQRAIREFEGTGRELALVQDLLMLLKAERLNDRWLELYLHVLYEHPTHQIVGVLSQDAMNIAKATGREEEVLHALQRVTAIPFQFAAKGQIEALLAGEGGSAPPTTGEYAP